jgi:hypothetical protein
VARDQQVAARTPLSCLILHAIGPQYPQVRTSPSSAPRLQPCAIFCHPRSLEMLKFVRSLVGYWKVKGIDEGIDHTHRIVGADRVVVPPNENSVA